LLRPVAQRSLSVRGVEDVVLDLVVEAFFFGVGAGISGGLATNIGSGGFFHLVVFFAGILFALKPLAISLCLLWSIG
jgi:hypothetical protein